MLFGAFRPPQYPSEIEGTGPVAVAASKLFRHQSVISRKELLLGALVEASFSAVGVDQVWAELQSYEQRGILVKLAGEERAECWTTPGIAASEARLLRAADRSDERDWFHLWQSRLVAQILCQDQRRTRTTGGGVHWHGDNDLGSAPWRA
jgi:hypothetical protein